MWIGRTLQRIRPGEPHCVEDSAFQVRVSHSQTFVHPNKGQACEVLASSAAPTQSLPRLQPQTAMRPLAIMLVHCTIDNRWSFHWPPGTGMANVCQVPGASLAPLRAPSRSAESPRIAYKSSFSALLGNAVVPEALDGLTPVP